MILPIYAIGQPVLKKVGEPIDKDYPDLKELIDEKVTFETFFARAELNPNAHLIKGVICGYRIEDIETPLTKQARYLDKLVDELARGRKMEKILRK